MCHRGFEQQRAQALAQCGKALLLLLLSAVQPHHAVCQHVFFHHIGQIVGRFLGFFSQAIQALGELAHHPRHAGREHHHHHRELPVQIQQVAHQRNQRKAVARHAHQRLHQHTCARLHLKHHRV